MGQDKWDKWGEGALSHYQDNTRVAQHGPTECIGSGSLLCCAPLRLTVLQLAVYFATEPLLHPLVANSFALFSIQGLQLLQCCLLKLGKFFNWPIYLWISIQLLCFPQAFKKRHQKHQKKLQSESNFGADTISTDNFPSTLSAAVISTQLFHIPHGSNLKKKVLH